MYIGLLFALVAIQYLVWHNENLIATQKLVCSLFSWIVPCIWIIIMLSMEKASKAAEHTRESYLFYHFTFALN
jgi:hypothetical protein